MEGGNPKARMAPERGRDTGRRHSITISYEARDYLLAQPVEASLLPGARNAVRSCLGLGPTSQLVLVVESGLEAIGGALVREAEELGVEVIAYLVDETHGRNEPFLTRLRSKLDLADASILVASTHTLPREFRRRMLPDPPHSRRHGHMIGISEAMMRQAMRADYEEVHALGERLRARLGPDSVLRVQSQIGTDLTIRCDPACRWYNASGLLRDGGLANLPGGELVTAPASVDGVLVPDGGAWLPDGTEVGRQGRLKMFFEGGRLTHAEGRAAESITAALDEDENGRRVGQVGFGTNTSVLTAIGALLQDLKMPGLHLTLGDSAAELTGAQWRADVQLPLLPRRPDVTIDGQPVLVRGRYVPALG